MKTKRIVCLLCLLFFLITGEAFAQNEKNDSNNIEDDSPKTSFFNPLSISFLTNSSAKGVDVSWGMLSYDRYFGETSSLIKKNATRVITLNYPTAYYIGPDNFFFVYPKVGLGYGWSVLEVKDYGTESEGAFVFNLHPQIGIQMNNFGLTIGYLYHAFKFKFDGKGVLSIGLTLGIGD